MSLSACKQVRHYNTGWMTALGDTLVFGCTLVEIVQLTQTDQCYPSLVNWIAVCYMASQKKLGQKKTKKVCCTTLPHFHKSEEAAALTCCCWLTCHCPALIKTCLSLHSAMQMSVIWRVHLQWPHIKSLIRTSGNKRQMFLRMQPCALREYRALKTPMKSTISGI